MGSLILCHKKKAKHPYEISRIHMRIYTIEELCYYFCNNLYLVDYTIINRQLCDWLDEELELYSLADELRAILDQNGPAEQFLLTVLSHASIYSASEITQRVTSRVGPGSIVLFHNAALHTPEALPTIIETLLQEGYTFLPISQLVLPGEYGEDYTIDHAGRQCPVS